MYALADYNPNVLITITTIDMILPKSISDVYIYLSEGVTEASRARSDTTLIYPSATLYIYRQHHPPQKKKSSPDDDTTKFMNQNFINNMHKY